MNDEVKEVTEATAEETKSLNELYAEKAEAMKEKYHDAIVAIAEAKGVGLGDAFDMLKATCRGGAYADGIEFDREALKADYTELLVLSEEIAKANGLL